MPTSNLPNNLSDRELLLVTLQQLAQLKTSVEESHHDMREQLARGNARFEQIAKSHSDYDARIERMIQPIARAGLEAQRALELARQSRDEIKELKEVLYGNKDEGTTGMAADVRTIKATIATWTTYAKITLALWAIVQALLIPLMVALIRSGWHF